MFIYHSLSGPKDPTVSSSFESRNFSNCVSSDLTIDFLISDPAEYRFENTALSYENTTTYKN